jgi:Ser/Thr protein kinase RdoA (MazF antagonist)
MRSLDATTDLTAELLSQYPLDCRPLSKPQSLGNAGGASGAVLWRYESGRGVLVARAWPDPGRTLDEIERIHGWLSETSDLGFVPIPLRTMDGRTVLPFGGRIWDLSPWMPGESLKAGPTDLNRVHAALTGLATLHVRLSRFASMGTSPGLAGRFREIDQLCHGGFDAIHRALASGPSDRPTDLARRWLRLAVPLAPRIRKDVLWGGALRVSLQPCLRDARGEHFLFRDDRLTGLVDFGAMDIESVSADLARLFSDWWGGDLRLRSQALAAYEDLRPLAVDELKLIDVFDRSAALLGGGHWIRWRFLDQRVFDNPNAVEHGLERGVDRITQLASTL